MKRPLRYARLQRVNLKNVEYTRTFPLFILQRISLHVSLLFTVFLHIFFYCCRSQKTICMVKRNSRKM